jgi:hypothetical protein
MVTGIFDQSIPKKVSSVTYTDGADPNLTVTISKPYQSI